MTPSWYDLLDVAPDAAPEEIRTAWRQGIEGLEPTDRRFAVRNQAAAVLLDPVKRAAYDAELAAQADDAVDVDETGETAGIEAAPPVPEVRAKRASKGRTAGEPVVRGSGPGALAPKQPEATVVGEAQAGDVVRDARRPVPGWLLVGLAVVTALVMAVGGYLYATSDSTTAVQDASQAARDTAERAVVPVFSYDYKTLDAGESTAENYMTASFKDTFSQTFSVIKQNAPALKAIQTATFVDSAVTLAQSDRVDVLLFFNLTASKNGVVGTPNRDYATLRMRLVDGDWLIDNVITQPITG